MATVQAIFVKGHENRLEPKPHTVYRIEIQGPVRSWQVWRRYSEFDDLNTELSKSVGSYPPTALPPKHTFSLRRKFNEEAIIKEREEGLEKYLRAILSNKDGRWRECVAFKTFLGLPATSSMGAATNDPSSSAGPQQFTVSSWLDEHTALQSLVRDIKADINKRNALSDAGEVSQSHQTNVQAKKKLATLLTRIGGLAKGLDDMQKTGMSDGEVQRRGDMIARLQDECEKLGKMVIAARQRGAYSSGSPAERNPASAADRAALLGASAAAAKVSNGGTITRKFGAAALETEQTRPLDDAGLVQLQTTEMDTQDSQLSQLSAILQRQKQIGLAIGSEIQEQNEMLDRLTDDVDRVGGKLAGAKKQLNRLG
ncbi:hypothetical protein FRC04_002612 [Tulasnella sp. 424]|nr:hypothetical protein FRC04_002612 [Tulasnella sp. 424]KAG8976827.1 hypothetical protein FRC05_003177 [Tulasnella sp. 425]